MPLVQIEVLRGRSAAEKKALFDAVHEALVETIKIPEDDRVQRLIEHEPDDFEAPSAAFTIVRVTMFPGRSAEAKSDLYEAIVESFEGLGVARNESMIILDEPALENWGIRGGTPASEVDLGYDLDI